MIITIDQCVDNKDSFGTSVGSGTNYLGQSFLNKNKIFLDSVIFAVKKNGTPIGNITAHIFSHIGIFGKSSGHPPTNTDPLATSDSYDVSNLSSSNYSYLRLTFTLLNRIVLQENTVYCCVIKFSNGDASNYIFCKIFQHIPRTFHDGVMVYSNNLSIWQSFTNDSTYSDAVVFNLYGNTWHNNYSHYNKKSPILDREYTPDGKRSRNVHFAIVETAQIVEDDI